MAIGGLLVAGLVAWALTRSVEPASVMETTTAPSPVAGTPTGTSASTTSTPPFSPAAPASDTGVFTPAPPGAGSVAEHSQDPAKQQISRISAEDLRAQHSRGEVVVIDVRDPNSFASGHIPGALHMPFANIQSRVAEIPRDKHVVTYCT